MLDPRLAKAYHTEDTLRYLVKAARHPGVIKAAGLTKEGQFPIGGGSGLLDTLLGTGVNRIFGPGAQGSLLYQLPSAILGEVASKQLRTGWKPYVRGYQMLSSNLGNISQAGLDRLSMFARGQPFNAPLF